MVKPEPFRGHFTGTCTCLPVHWLQNHVFRVWKIWRLQLRTVLLMEMSFQTSG